MRKILPAITNPLIVLTMLALSVGAMKAQQQPPTVHAKVPAVQQPPTDDKHLGATQEELLKLLRVSPKLTMVVIRDPSLLANQDYVSHNNPALAQFLQEHPDVVRNPEFYLFNNIGDDEGRSVEVLERKVWPELPERQEPPWVSSGDVVPFAVFICVLGSLIWLIRLLLENRRWSRIFRLQTDVHNKLIEKFGTSQELLAYMGTDAGKRFLEAAPIPVDFEHSQPMPSPVARVLMPLQIGIVLTLLGFGFVYLRHNLPQGTTPLLVFGTLTLMLGFGFIISAGVTWFLAQHLGLMPQAEAQLHDPRNQQ
jgi:hypothetical protein